MSRHPPPRTLLAFIDAIDRAEGVARLLPSGEEPQRAHRFPAALLPQGVGEGSWIELRITAVDPPAAEDPTALRRALGQGDDGGDLTL